MATELSASSMCFLLRCADAGPNDSHRDYSRSITSEKLREQALIDYLCVLGLSGYVKWELPWAWCVLDSGHQMGLRLESGVPGWWCVSCCCVRLMKLWKMQVHPREPSPWDEPTWGWTSATPVWAHPYARSCSRTTSGESGYTLLLESEDKVMHNPKKKQKQNIQPQLNHICSSERKWHLTFCGTLHKEFHLSHVSCKSMSGCASVFSFGIFWNVISLPLCLLKLSGGWKNTETQTVSHCF